jgi:cation diffusion facilitator CzcD-associated flavoprotein CzcO
MKQNSTTVSVAIIGAGFGGIGTAIQLLNAGIQDFVILERAETVGGVWQANTYPGAECDVPSHLYSFSFEPNPNWSRKFSPQPEIRAYLEHCEQKYGLTPYIRFNSSVAGARYDEAAKCWRVECEDGHQVSAQVLVKGTGQLSQPAIPNIPGLEDFASKQFHSAYWDHEYDLSDKHVAVVGTGASVIQFIPHLAKQAKKLTVFQRTPPWVLAKPNRHYSRFEKWLFAKLPFFGRLERRKIYWNLEWRFAALSKNSFIRPLFNLVCNSYRRLAVSDPELRKKLTPNYPLGCNRILLSSDYFPALSRPNVEVVCDGVAEVKANGLLGQSGQFVDADTIVFGTGFKATEFASPITITGLQGQDLNDRWQDGAEAYYGMTVDGFPNFFMLYGPNTNLGHNSIIFMLEAQIHYLVQCVKRLQKGDVKQMNLRPAVMQAFNQTVQKKADNAVWSAGCNNWYRHASGKSTNNWPDFTLRYRLQTRRVNFDDYELEGERV